MKKTKKRLIVEVGSRLHKKIKLLAVNRNITMRTWLIRAIVEAIKEEERFK